MPKVVGDGPAFCQGDNEARPKPVPKVTSKSAVDSATTAPAAMAPQLTADPLVSTPAACIGRSDPVTGMVSISVEKQDEDEDDRDWHAQQPKQNSAAHIFVPLICNLQRNFRAFVPA